MMRLTWMRLTGRVFGPVVPIAGIISFWVLKFLGQIRLILHLLVAEILLANTKGKIYILNIYYFGGRS